jgi:hypothetical protein
MNHKQLVRILGVCVSSVVALALVGCDSGGGGGGTGGGGGSSGSSNPSSSGTASGAMPLSCPSGGYCPFGNGGYAFGYSDSQNTGTQMPGMSTATLATDGSLCITGNVMQLPPMPTQTQYSDFWGCGIGVNLNQAADAGPTVKGVYMLPTGTGVTVNVNSVPKCTQARVVLDDMMGATSYCSALTPGVEIPWASFSTTCWNTTGTTLTGPPTSQAIKVQFVTSTSEACMFTDFCITEIKL